MISQVTLERLKQSGVNLSPEMLANFKKRFGGIRAPIAEFVVWTRNLDKDGGSEATILSLRDTELVVACIENGANPHACNDKALSYAAEDGDPDKVETLKVLLKYKPSLQALKNALDCTLSFSWSSNPKIEALLKNHIRTAETESSKEKRKRAKAAPKVSHRIIMSPVVSEQTSE